MSQRRGTRLLWACLTALTLLGPGLARAAFVPLTLEELSQTADLILAGTVAGQEGRAAGGMILTDVELGDVRVIHAGPRAVQAGASRVCLTFAGGRAGGREVWASTRPSFETGRRYLLFLQDDGRTYLNPVVGGPQGQFLVLTDPGDGQEYLASASGRPVLAVGPEGLTLGRGRIAAVVHGLAQVQAPAEVASWRFDQPPTSADPRAWAEPVRLDVPAQVRPLSLEAFSDHLLGYALRSPLTERRLPQPGARGRFLRRQGDEVVALDFPSAKAAAPASAISAGRPGPRGGGRRLAYFWDDPNLFACGYQAGNIFWGLMEWLVMEEVSSSWWSYPHNEMAMWTWNLAADIFRVRDDDGSFEGDNGDSEFAGFPDDAAYYRQYGSHWGSASAMTLMYRDDCCEWIDETDIAFNPAFSWTDDLNIRLATKTTLLYQTAVIHETGHAWGLHAGGCDGLPKETYAYDHPSVMNGTTSDIMEDGLGIHVPDAYLMRRIYGGDFGVPQLLDVGVESYYADGGLRRSWTDKGQYRPGELMTINNFTVENLSPFSLSGISLQFYLSPSREVSAWNQAIGPRWNYPAFPAENYALNIVSLYLPASLEPGTYYLGAAVFINNETNDDFPWNNFTTFYSPVVIVK